MAKESWGQYLDQIGDIPLLSRDEVTAASQVFHRGERARARLADASTADGLDVVDVVDAVDVARLQREVEEGRHAKHLLVTSNLRLVVSIARRYRVSGGVAMADLVQEGAFGLIRAVEKFDPDRGIAFSTYATWWIRQAVSRSVAEQSRALRVPKHVSDEMAACVRARDALADRLGYVPSVRHVAQVCDLDEARAAVLLRGAAPAQPWDVYAAEGHAEPAAEGEPGSQALDQLRQRDISERLEAAMLRLPAEHRRLMAARLGWSGPPQSLRSAAKAQGISRDVARRIEQEARDILGRLPQVVGLRDWIEG
jgi:RNA polymerase primary sigma factor